MLTVLFQSPSKDDISTLSALEIAEQMTYLDQKIMFTINSNEFLEQAWMKSERKEKAPHIVVMTKRFNDVSEGIYRLDRTVFLKISSYFSTCQTQNLTQGTSFPNL